MVCPPCAVAGVVSGRAGLLKGEACASSCPSCKTVQVLSALKCRRLSLRPLLPWVSRSDPSAGVLGVGSPVVCSPHAPLAVPRGGRARRSVRKHENISCNTPCSGDTCRGLWEVLTVREGGCFLPWVSWVLLGPGAGVHQGGPRPPGQPTPQTEAPPSSGCGVAVLSLTPCRGQAVSSWVFWAAFGSDTENHGKSVWQGLVWSQRSPGTSGLQGEPPGARRPFPRGSAPRGRAWSYLRC